MDNRHCCKSCSPHLPAIVVGKGWGKMETPEPKAFIVKMIKYLLAR
jgi:hypothetical protein